MNRNFIQGHPFHQELSPYLLLVSSALLITTLSWFYINPTVQLIVFPALSLVAELLVLNFECLLIIFLIVSFILSHSYTICKFIIPFFIEVVILLLYFLTFGRLTYVYKVIEFKVISKRQKSIIKAYRIN